MISRPALARVAVGLLLGAVLGVVLHESNTRNSSIRLTAALDNQCYTVMVGSSCPSGTPIGNGCYINNGLPCDCGNGQTGICGAGACVNCVGASSYAPPMYCCGYGDQAGQCISVTTETQDLCDMGIKPVGSDPGCNGGCTTPSSYSSSYCPSGACPCTTSGDCPGPGDDPAHTECCDGYCALAGTCMSSSSSSSSEEYCCNVQTGNCELTSTSAPAI